MTEQRLNVKQELDAIELKWTSETGKTAPQAAAALRGNPWSTVLEQTAVEGSFRTMRVPIRSNTRFFRLQTSETN